MGPLSKRRGRCFALVVLAAGLVGATSCGSGSGSGSGGGARSPAKDAATAPHHTPAPVADPIGGGPSEPRARSCPCPNLVAGSDPRVLPTGILIADHLNNRLIVVNPNGSTAWQFPRPGDLAPGQTFRVPDDAFFTPDGKGIVVTQEDDDVISLIDIARHRIVWTYGTPGTPGLGPNQVNHPDDAMMMPSGDIILADIKNCRVIVLRPGRPAPVRVYGETTNSCLHAPAGRWGSPNGAFPMSNGQYLVTEINGDWVDGLSLAGGGRVSFSANPPGVLYPSDTNEVRPGVYLTVDYSNPGQIVEFDRAGRLLWRFTPDGSGVMAPMNKPSLALSLPNGDILCNDDYNHRVIVVDPRRNRIVWQYGHTGVSGIGAGYLYDPDGVDLVPPYSFTVTRASTMGVLP